MKSILQPQNFIPKPLFPLDQHRMPLSHIFSSKPSTKSDKLSSYGLRLSVKRSLRSIPLMAKPVEVVTNPISKVMKAVRTPIIWLAVFGILATCTYSAWAASDGSRGVGGTSRCPWNISLPYRETSSCAGAGGDSGAGELYVRFYVEAEVGVAVGALLLSFLYDRSEGSAKTVPFTATELKSPRQNLLFLGILIIASVFSSNGLDTKAGKSGKQVKMRKNKAKKICRVKKNGLDTKAGKSRKQIKMRKNKTKKIRVVKKTEAGDDAEAGKK